VTGAAADHILKLDHVGIAVTDIAAPVALFHDTLGGRFLAGGDNDETGIRLVHLMLHGFKVELLQPLREDSILARSIDAHGTGFHHMTFFVDDVLATAEALEDGGLRMTGTDVTSAYWKETFVSPADSFGALLQFVATTREWDVPTRDFALEDVLAGRVVWRAFVPCVRTGS
jgi:methylmalonyl-CoA/ethylmalonyl-CoA epimerase